MKLDSIKYKKILTKKSIQKLNYLKEKDLLKQTKENIT